MENSSAGDLEKLEKLYAAMSDEEFVSIRKTDLTDVARECYDREAARRGLFAGIVPTAPGKSRRIGGGFFGMRVALWIWFRILAFYVRCFSGRRAWRVALWIWFWILAFEDFSTFQRDLAGIWDGVHDILIFGPLLAIYSGWIVVSDRVQPTETWKRVSGFILLVFGSYWLSTLLNGATGAMIVSQNRYGMFAMFAALGCLMLFGSYKLCFKKGVHPSAPFGWDQGFGARQWLKKRSNR